MTKRIFVSYSSPDVAKANLVREALEDHDISCWIAPRDLSAGTQWGAGIVQAIQGCEAVVVVFSDAANGSPQVAREMELAVSNRKPLVPIRVADAMPTDDMQYFLRVSHWFNAYAMPIEAYLPDIITAVKNVLARERNPWASVTRRMPRTRTGQIAWSVAGALLIAVVVGLLMRPSLPRPERNPLVGRWEAKIPDGKGGTADCILDVNSSSQAVYTDACPAPLTGARQTLMVMKDNTLAPSLYKSGDSGTFSFIGGGPSGYVAAYKFGFFGGLTTRDNPFGEVSWSKISSEQPLKSGMDNIVTDPAWPLRDMPGIARRSRDYVRAKWQADAQLMSMDVKLLRSNEGGIANVQTPQGGVSLSMRFYSPNTQQGVDFTPKSTIGALFPLGVIDTYGDGPLPDDFLDFPQAVTNLESNGMHAKQIHEAQIQDWGRETSAGHARMHGVEWMIDSQLDERFVVPALTK
jgi:hypothetical protein